MAAIDAQIRASEGADAPLRAKFDAAEAKKRALEAKRKEAVCRTMRAPAVTAAAECGDLGTEQTARRFAASYQSPRRRVWHARGRRGVMCGRIENLENSIKEKQADAVNQKNKFAPVQQRPWPTCFRLKNLAAEIKQLELEVQSLPDPASVQQEIGQHNTQLKACNERLRDISQRQSEIKVRAPSMQLAFEHLCQADSAPDEARIRAVTKELKDLESAEGQKLNLLMREDHATYTATQWLRENRLAQLGSELAR